MSSLQPLRLLLHRRWIFFLCALTILRSFPLRGRRWGGFIKREGKPSEREILTCRLIDRPLRPMFEEGFYDDVQVLSYVWSYDGEHSPDPLAICAASAALVLSDIPLVKPVAAVRVGLCNGLFVVNPTIEEMRSSALDLMLAGTDEAILMIEGYCDFLTEEQVIEAITTGHQAIKRICEALSEWREEIGKPKNRSTLRHLPHDLVHAVEKQITEPLKAALQLGRKQDRESATSTVKKNLMATFAPEGQASTVSELQLKEAFDRVHAKILRESILKTGRRVDGRSVTDIRAIDVEVGLLPRVHGSCLFTRGETQTMAVCTLGSESMGQRFEDLNGDGLNRFYLQYFFPPFSVGEVGRIGPPGRREVGHGKLAERSLQRLVPEILEFPYVVRLESNITESNGSSSMASVCGCCLAMMDAGVPIKRPVAGIAMGLILEKDEVAILSDILGLEDALGDMDFKVAGDAEGITAFQMDIKVEGITIDIMRKALQQAKQGRIHILQKMLDILPASKTEMSLYAPRIETIQVKPSKIGLVIGPGGKQIRSIVEETGAQIDISDSGLVSISASNKEAMARAKEIIEGLVGEVEVLKIYQGKVTSVVQFGVFVEIMPGKEGLCHISELSEKRLSNNIADYGVKEGDVFPVKVLEINDRGQYRLSRRAALAQT